MNTLQTQINKDILDALKNKKTERVSVLRQLKNVLSNIALNSGNIANSVNDTDVISAIRKQISQREDSINAFNKANRHDLVEKEAGELVILREYLPVELSSDELDELIKTTIADLGATSKKDMGRVMKQVIASANGRADSKTVSQKVATLLP